MAICNDQNDDGEDADADADNDDDDADDALMMMATADLHFRCLPQPTSAARSVKFSPRQPKVQKVAPVSSTSPAFHFNP